MITRTLLGARDNVVLEPKVKISVNIDPIQTRRRAISVPRPRREAGRLRLQKLRKKKLKMFKELMGHFAGLTQRSTCGEVNTVELALNEIAIASDQGEVVLVAFEEKA